MRKEHDSLGEIDVPSTCLWGAQTQRALSLFEGTKESWPAPFIHAFGWQKWAAACTNQRLGILSSLIAPAVIHACQEVGQGHLDAHFPLDIWQTSGSGTQIHMNVNEVIANRATSLIGQRVHPHDHVNFGQSSNDTVPTVMHITLAQEMVLHFLPALDRLQQACVEKGMEWQPLLKVGRTHLQDAVTISLGDEFDAFAHQLAESKSRLTFALSGLYELAQGGTAVGNGLNCPPGFVDHFFCFLHQIFNLPFRPARHPFAAQSAHDALVCLSGALNGLACVLAKMSLDVRWMVSGPLCGLSELIQPSNEPGSSIMPGKINPSQAEVLTMAAYYTMGLHQAATLAGVGQFQLNTAKPLLFLSLWRSLITLTASMTSFTTHFLQPLRPNLKKLAQNCRHNIMDLTALNPQLGYDQVAQMVAQSYKEELQE